jgi:hypothetical protein
VRSILQRLALAEIHPALTGDCARCRRNWSHPQPQTLSFLWIATSRVGLLRAPLPARVHICLLRNAMSK